MDYVVFIGFNEFAQVNMKRGNIRIRQISILCLRSEEGVYDSFNSPGQYFVKQGQEEVGETEWTKFEVRFWDELQAI
jgi:hypothetical protein